MHYRALPLILVLLTTAISTSSRTFGAESADKQPTIAAQPAAAESTPPAQQTGSVAVASTDVLLLTRRLEQQEAEIRALRDRFNLIVANGQGSMEGKLFRLAHLGYYDYPELAGSLAALELVLNSIGHKVEPGAGVRAAQQVAAAKLS